MSIDGVNILYNWFVWFVVNDEIPEEMEKAGERFSELESRASAGDEDAQAAVAGVRAENAEDVAKNLATLEALAAKGNALALLSLGVLYHEGIAENGDAPSKTVILPLDMKKSDFYLAQAEEKGNLTALYMLCLHTWFRCCVFTRPDEEGEDLEDSERIYALPTEEDFLNGEKWLLKMIALAADKSLDDEKREYAESKESDARIWLSALYESDYPTSPIHNPEKAREWGKKSSKQ